MRFTDRLPGAKRSASGAAELPWFPASDAGPDLLHESLSRQGFVKQDFDEDARRAYIPENSVPDISSQNAFPQTIFMELAENGLFRGIQGPGGAAFSEKERRFVRWERL